MAKPFIIPFFLTGSWHRWVFILTFATTVLAPFLSSRAANDIGFETENTPVLMMGRPVTSPFDDEEQRKRVGLLLDYVRNQSPTWVPGLPRGLLPNPSAWAVGNLRTMIRNGLEEEARDGSTLVTVIKPAAAMMDPPEAREAEALWLSPTYHHKGFLPFNDAMMMGVSGRHEMFDGLSRIEVHPYYAQNWLSTEGYWGGECSASFTPSKPTEGSTPSWGKISLGYINGDSNLMDHGHGIDMHSEWHFDDHLSLNAGMRENEESEMGNYVMLRWKLLSN